MRATALTVRSCHSYHGACSVFARAMIAAALLGFFVITLYAVEVNVALPVMWRELFANVNALQW